MSNNHSRRRPKARVRAWTFAGLGGKRPQTMDGERTFHFRTLGCKVNAYDAQALREELRARGYVEADSPDDASLLVVNTCAVTARAAAESRRIAAALRRDHPRAEIIAAGCAVRAVPGFLDGLPGIAAVPVIAEVAATLPVPPDAPLTPQTATGEGVSDFPRARAVIKVQDGCSHGCAYCIVPRARGASRSRPVDQVSAEALRLAAAGFREIVLSGINLGHYGRDLPQTPDFWDLLAALGRALESAHPGQVRLRLSSLDPGMLTQKALDVLSDAPSVCPHLHVSLQSAAPEVLAAMRRGHYRPEAVADFVAKMGRIWPVMALGADILTGFPGESDADFRTTLDFCRALPLTYAHVFPYSRRPGSLAASFPGQLPADVKKERARILRDLARDKKTAFARTVAALPRLAFVAERVGPARGVCEYYLECRLEGPGQGGILPRRLVAAVPFGVAGADATDILVRAASPTPPPGDAP
ncbi:MiaB/RimO family radical SAM methylthiotransferase [Desulfolutivibrio sp.]|uniref:MiaB/RimO family radical SAM methylthiotransferase n=1 Tax=Desulfolutivibrio sp. TaxID=2773296 RepID=UPI002F96ABFA